MEPLVWHGFGKSQQQRSAGLWIHEQFQNRLPQRWIKAVVGRSQPHLRCQVVAGLQQRPGSAVGWRQAARVVRLQQRQGSR